MKLRHLVLLAGLVAGGNAPVPAAASDGLLAGPPRTVHKQFNVASRKFNSRQRMILTECSGAADVQICNYTVTGRLALVAWSQEGNKEKLQSVTLIYAKGSRAVEMFIAMATLMEVYSPGSDRSEQGVAMIALAEAIKTDAGEGSVLLDDISYSVSNLGGWAYGSP